MVSVTAMTVRVPEDLKRRMRVRAAKAEKSLNAWITEALMDVTRMEEEDEQPPRSSAPASR